MPNAEKAILNPFDPLSIPQALMVAVCGILVVFMMLAILAVVIVVISKVVGAMEGKKKPAAPAPKKAAPAAALAGCIKANAGENLESLTLFDVYTGEKVGEGKKSLAYNLVFRAADRTLTDEEVDGAISRVLKALGEMGVTLRS